jgi:hypothetical protein
MPLVSPISGAVGLSTEIVSAALGSIAIGYPASLASALATSSIRGEDARAARGTAVLTGETLRASRGGADVGTWQGADGQGSLDAGTPQAGLSLGTEAVAGERPVTSLSTLEVGNSGETGAAGRKVAGALAGLDVGGNAVGSSRGTAQVRGVRLDSGRASIDQTEEGQRYAPASLELANFTQESVGASLDAGEVKDGAGYISLEVEAAEGLDIVVDIMDATIATARGDVC